jgi:hypothetical protein
MALLASSFIKYVIGNYANSVGMVRIIIFSIEVADSSLLMLVKLLLVYKKGLKVFLLCSQGRELIYGRVGLQHLLENQLWLISDRKLIQYNRSSL